MLLPARYLGDVLDQVLFPAMSKIQDDVSRLSQVYLCGVEVVNLILCPLGVYSIVWATELVELVLGPQWLDAVLPFQILVLSMAFRTVVRMADSLVRASGRVYVSALIKAVFFLLVVFGSYLGSFWGLAGVAAGVSLATLLHFAMMSYLGIRIVRTQWLHYLSKLWPGILLGVVFLIPNMTLHLVLTHIVRSVFVTLVGATAVNILCLWFLWRYQSKWFGPEVMWVLQQTMNLLPQVLQVKLSFLFSTERNR
jgi:PST family polysaccharide transporter